MKSFFRLVFISTFLSLFSLTLLANGSEKVTYKWTDEKGFVQYTERPPKDRAYEMIKILSSGGKEVTNVSADEAIAKSSKANRSELDEVVIANKRNCEIAKQNMDVLTKLKQIQVKDADGNPRILTDAEKQARVDDTQAQIDVYCK